MRAATCARSAPAQARRRHAIGFFGTTSGPLLGGFGGGDLLAQHSPSHIGPKVFTARGAASGTLDGRALLGWHLALALHPLIHRWRLHLEDSGQSRLAADFLRGGSDCVCVHTRDDKAEPYLVKHCLTAR